MNGKIIISGEMEINLLDNKKTVTLRFMDQVLYVNSENVTNFHCLNGKIETRLKEKFSRPQTEEEKLGLK